MKFRESMCLNWLPFYSSLTGNLVSDLLWFNHTVFNKFATGTNSLDLYFKEVFIGFLQDHLALMMELLGKMPRKASLVILSPLSCSTETTFADHICIFLLKQIAIGGASSKDYFDRHGDLKNIRRLKYCSLDRLLVNKYKFSWHWGSWACWVSLSPSWFCTREETNGSAVSATPMAQYHGHDPKGSEERA